jgi:hypothetical protein
MSSYRRKQDPAVDRLRVELSQETSNGVQVFIADITGREIYQAYSESVSFTIPLAGFQNGSYVLKIAANEKTAYRKFFIAN